MFLLNEGKKVCFESRRKQIKPPYIGLCELELGILFTTRLPYTVV